jgi:curved DNA-binding protein
MFFGGMAAGGQAAGGRSTRTGQATGGQSIEDLLAGMGMRPDAAATTREPRRTSYEAEAEVTLEEAFHGTTRLLEVGGRRLEVKIPRGVSTGSRVKLTGKGPGGTDVVVVVRVAPHPIFSRHGRDLERELPLSLEEALLGASVQVGTLKGRVLLTVAPGTQNGKRIRLKGQGMPALRGDERGDLYVRTRVVLPTDLSEDARAAARRFLDLAHQPDPRAS